MSVVFKSYKNEVESALENAISRALETIGGMAESDVKQKITQNHSVVTGTLRNSITHQRFDERTEIIGTKVEYAPFVELGTSRARAKPYMRPAIEGNINKYKKVAEQELKTIT